jgi:hypothetical protein
MTWTDYATGGYIVGNVYVPTKWGGELELSGSSPQLFYTSGSDLSFSTAVKIIKGELDPKGSRRNNINDLHAGAMV